MQANTCYLREGEAIIDCGHRVSILHYAHSTPTPDCSDWQSLPLHAAAVAARATTFASRFHAQKAAALAGMLHDLGKYSSDFQLYIKGKQKSGGDHSTAGAREVSKLVAPHTKDAVVAELLEYVIAGHHAGLPDRRGSSASLNDRLARTPAKLDETWRSELALDATKLWPSHFKARQGRVPSAFQVAFLGRMIFSCLVDADYLDTEAFYAGVKSIAVDRSWPVLGERIDDLIARFDRHMADKVITVGRSVVDSALHLHGDLNHRRADILAHARQKAELSPGLFTLNVPTGGGKTLTSLGFALEHARRWGKRRIVYAIPFTSVIEQTAKIFREVFGDAFILEHHSSIELPSSRHEQAIDQGATDSKLRLAMENWQAPIVVTTNVQLLESLFASRTSRCRKLHNLSDAIIILDEAQTIPLHVLRPSVAALDELARNYGCTIVLCTATQPALTAPRFEDGFDIGPERELAPEPAHLHRVLRRTTQRFAGEMSDPQLIAEIAAAPQGLVIVNSRKHALMLYEAAHALGLDGLVHLSTRQTAADRQNILEDVRARLKLSKPCRVIATSLIEAGVDIDFPRAWRAEAGLDQMMQAAGRVNREGRHAAEDSIITIFRPAEAKPPNEIASLIGSTERILNDHAGDLFSPQAIEAYFREVYWTKGKSGLDRVMLRNPENQPVPKQVLEQFVISDGRTDFAYRSVGEAFRLIEDGMDGVIIANDVSPRAALQALHGGKPPGAVARDLQRYIVQIPGKAHSALIAAGHIQFVEGFGDQFAVLTNAERYSREIGLRWENPDELSMSQTFV